MTLTLAFDPEKPHNEAACLVDSHVRCREMTKITGLNVRVHFQTDHRGLTHKCKGFLNSWEQDFRVHV